MIATVQACTFVMVDGNGHFRAEKTAQADQQQTDPERRAMLTVKELKRRRILK